jgi:hypothetical protein
MFGILITVSCFAAFVLLYDVFPSPFTRLHWMFLFLGCWTAFSSLQARHQQRVGYVIKKKLTRNDIVFRIGDLEWSLEDFVRGWFISGKTGAGKTAAGICIIMDQLFKNVPNWGGMCVDQKGLFYRILEKAAKAYRMEEKLALIRVRSLRDPKSFISPNTINLIGDLEIESEVYATAIIDTADSLGRIGSGGSSDHFKSQAQIHIQFGIDLKRIQQKPATLFNIYEMLTSESEMREELKVLREYGESIEAEDFENAQECARIYNHFTEKYLGLADDERSGVKSTILNALHPFTHKEIRKVFCAEKPTTEFKLMDQGKIFCFSIPQQFPATRTFINALGKLNFFSHGLRRADLPESDIEDMNLLVIFNDEAQRTVTKNEVGMADHNCLDQTREFLVTGVYATQAESSFLPKLGKDITDTLILNLANEFIFSGANKYSADRAAERIGEDFKKRETKNFNGATISHSYTKEVQPLIYSHELRGQKKFECIVRHCEKGYIRIKLSPTSFTARSPELDKAFESKEANLPEPIPEELNPKIQKQKPEPELSA